MSLPRNDPWWRRYGVGLLWAIAVAIVILQRFEPGRHGVYLIFRSAFVDLMARRNLYATHPGSLDFFRYSPTFALFFAPMAVGPFQIGVALWTVLNAAALYCILGRLLPGKPAQIVRLLVLGDTIRSLQNSQSNPLVTALMIAAFLAYEGQHLWRAGWATWAGTAIKLFPAGTGLFALIRPFRVRALLTLAVTALVVALLPAVILGPGLLFQEFHWWMVSVRNEAYRSMYSFMDLVDVWTGHYWPRWPMQAAGLVALLVPVALRRDRWTDPGWRLRLLCSVLVFSVLFNHGAESPSYVIATTGIAIWWAVTPRSRAHNVLLILTLLFSTVGRSSLVPTGFRIQVLDAARVMVLPALAAWLLMQLELLKGEGVSPDAGGPEDAQLASLRSPPECEPSP